MGGARTITTNDRQTKIKKIEKEKNMTRKLKKRKKNYPIEIQIENLTDNFAINQFKDQSINSINPLKALIKKENFDNLSREAKFVISLIIWSPLDLFSATKRSTKMTLNDVIKVTGGGINIIKKFLIKRMGLYPFQAIKVINEIEEYSKNI